MQCNRNLRRVLFSYFFFSFDILRMFPNCGYRRMRGFLRARGLHIQWSRIQGSMKRVCPEGILMRALQLTTVERRIYNVRSPLSLWHIDGNHKLIRFVSTQCSIEIYILPGVAKNESVFEPFTLNPFEDENKNV